MTELNLEEQKICPSCQNQRVILVDQIPPILLENPERKAIFKSSLYRCLNCHLYFRSPQLSLSDLDQLYNEEGVDYLHGFRKDWRLITDFIGHQTLPDSTILDVGCFDGKFLDYFDSVNKGWQRSGVELNHEAAEEAERKGIKIVARDFNALSDIQAQFSVITAIDIIEHGKNPEELLRNMLRLTRPGGVVIISTGNTNALAPRIMGAKYWYYMFPGHISFINRPWLKRTARELNTRIVEIKQFSHGDSNSFVPPITDGVKNIIYKLSPKGFSLLRKAGLGGIDTTVNPELKYYPPNWRSAKDHLLIVLEKKS